jgi:hypothetical protein
VIFVDETIEISRQYGKTTEPSLSLQSASRRLIPDDRSMHKADETSGVTDISTEKYAPTSQFCLSLSTGPAPKYFNFCVPTSSSKWGLENVQQASLMQHFVQVLANSFDIFDPERHFTVQVPCRAAKSPILRDAIFALAARHLSIFSKCDPYVADTYHDRCIEELLPVIDQSNTIMSEDLLCAIGILRFLEELEGRSYIPQS